MAKKMKLRGSVTVIGVVIFLILLTFASFEVHAQDGAKISLGHTFFSSQVTHGEIGYEKNNWEINYGIFGTSEKLNGDDGLVHVGSVSKLVRPDWTVLGGKNYYRLGIAYIDDTKVVGNYNYRLGIGLDYKAVKIEYFHYSSANINLVNYGIDGILLRLNLLSN